MTQLLSDGTASAQLGVDRKVINRAIGSPDRRAAQIRSAEK